MADAGEIVHHLLLFETQLGRVGQVLPLTAAAHAEMAAERLDTLLRAAHKADNPPNGMLLAFLDYLHIHDISRSAKRHENDHIIHSCQGVSLGSDISNGHIFKQWKVFPFSQASCIYSTSKVHFSHQTQKRMAAK
jgi:hypothetical protein